MRVRLLRENTHNLHKLVKLSCRLQITMGSGGSLYHSCTMGCFNPTMARITATNNTVPGHTKIETTCEPTQCDVKNTGGDETLTQNVRHVLAEILDIDMSGCQNAGVE